MQIVIFELQNPYGYRLSISDKSSATLCIGIQLTYANTDVRA